jgi:hypothetical protein
VFSDPVVAHARGESMYFIIGDYVAGVLIGGVTAMGVRLVVWPGMDMVIAMIVGMAAGMGIHAVMGVLIAPLLGMFTTMVPAMIIGMYGGMLFAMRDSMGAGSESLSATAGVGAFFGFIVVVALKLYDRVLRGVVVDAEE